MAKIVLRKEKLHGHPGFKAGHDLAFNAVGFALDHWRGAGGPKNGLSIIIPKDLPAGTYTINDHSTNGDEIEFDVV